MTGISCAVLALIIALNMAAKSLPKPIAMLARLIYSLGIEMLIFPVALLLYPASCLFRRSVSSKAKNQRPILLIHGYLHNASAWAYMMHRFKRAKLGSIYAIDLRPRFTSIHNYVQIVRDKVAQIQQETGQQEVLLIGHSMGGLVALQAALDLALPAAVAIASPLQGTPMAYLGIGENARQMRPGSSYVTDLQERLRKNQDMQCLQIGAIPDLIVPGSYAFSDPGPQTEKFLVSDLGHLGVLYSPTIADKLIAWLQHIDSPLL